MSGKNIKPPQKPGPVAQSKKPRSEWKKPELAKSSDSILFRGPNDDVPKMYTVQQVQQMYDAQALKTGAQVGKERREAFKLEVLNVIYTLHGANITSKALGEMIKGFKNRARAGKGKDANPADKEFLHKVGLLGTTAGNLVKEGLLTRVKVKGHPYFYSMTPAGMEAVGQTAETGTVEVAAKEADELTKDL